MICADKIEGFTKNIPNHFRNVYDELYNSVQVGDEIEIISEKVKNKITLDSDTDDNKVTKEEMKKASRALKQ